MKIVKEKKIQASVSTVWKSIADHKEFGRWFGAKIVEPFEVGKISTGTMTIPGFEHLPWKVRIVTIEKEKVFSFEWPPYIDGDTDLSGEPWTLVEIECKEIPEGTLLQVIESGFNKVSATYRQDARRSNEQGWDFQLDNIAKHAE